MKKLLEVPIDFEYLLFAYQDKTQDNAYYLDTKFGDIRLVNRNLNDLKDLTDEVEKGYGRFLYVPKPPKEDLLDDLRTFLNSVEDPKLASLLAIAFESPHVEESFRAILSKEPSQLSRFEEYTKVNVVERVNKWLDANAIKAVPKISSPEDFGEDFDDDDDDDRI
jgi:hypothetical protein